MNMVSKDNREPSPSINRPIRINEVLYAMNFDMIEIKNYGGNEVDLSGWSFRIGKNQVSFNELQIIAGRLILEPGQMLLISGFNLNDIEDAISLYDDGNTSARLIDFLQYGKANQPGEAKAVSAGYWNYGDYIPTVIPSHSIEFDGQGKASGDWIDQAYPTPGAENRLREVGSSESAMYR